MDILGNEPIREQFSSMIQRDRLHHCFLFEGPEGVGKFRTAKWLAQLLLCPKPIEKGVQACGTCGSCVCVEREDHWNMVFVGLDPTKKKKQISVAQARELVKTVALYPQGGGKRVVIFDEAASMTEEAANALLKTLEEPPTETIFILITTSAQHMLPTIRSRSQKVRFSPVPSAEIVEWLVAKGLVAESKMVQMAQGCPGKVLSLLQGEYEQIEQTMHSVMQMIQEPLVDMYQRSKDMFGNFPSATASQMRAELLSRSLECLEMLLRDIVVLQSVALDTNSMEPTDLAALLYWPQHIVQIQKWASRFDARTIATLHREIEQARDDQEINVNPQLHLEMLVVLWKRAVSAGYLV